MKDDEKLEAGLAKMDERNTAELQPKRERLALVAEMVDKADRMIKRLAASFGDEEDDAVAHAVKNEMRMIGKQWEALIKEQQSIESDLSRIEFSPAVKDGIRAKERMIRGKLAEPTVEQKRQLLDVLDFQAIYRMEEGVKLLDVKCELKPEGDLIALPHSRKEIPDETIAQII